MIALFNSELTEKIRQAISNAISCDIHIQNATQVAGGCINNACKLSTNAGIFFVKWKANIPSDLFVREAEGLNELARVKGSSLVFPRVITCKKEDHLPGFLVLEYLEPGMLEKTTSERLGHGLAKIHQTFHDKYGYDSDTYCGTTRQNNKWNDSWPDFFRFQRIGCLIEQLRDQGKLTTSEIGLFEKLIQKIPMLIPAERKASLIHGDLWSGNYLITQKSPALIDPAVYYADREMEFSIMTMFGGFSSNFWSAYQEAFPFQSGWKERNRLYQLYHYLNHYLLFGGGYGQKSVDIAKQFI